MPSWLTTTTSTAPPKSTFGDWELVPTAVRGVFRYRNKKTGQITDEPPWKGLPTVQAIALGAPIRPARDLPSVAAGLGTGVARSLGVELQQRETRGRYGLEPPRTVGFNIGEPAAQATAERISTALGIAPLGLKVASAVDRAVFGARTVAESPSVVRTPAVQKLIAALRQAKPVRAAQEAAYSAERSQRLGRVLQVAEAIPGEAGAKAMLAELKGELPKVKFEPIVRQRPTVSAQPAMPSNLVSDPAAVNARTWYHGTGTVGLRAASLDPLATRAENLFGQGIYLTDNPKIAAGYARARAGAGVAGTVYRAKVNIGRVLDLEKPIAPEALAAIRNGADREFHSVIDGLPRGVTGEGAIRQLSRAVSDYSHAEQIPAYEFDQMFGNIAENLRRAGYDALTYTGGRRTGNVAHRVLVVLDPNDLYGVGRPGQVTELAPLARGVAEGISPAAARAAQTGKPVLTKAGQIVLTNPEVDELFDVIKASPALPGYSKVSASTGLMKTLAGAVPQESELRLLGRVFGENFVKAASRTGGTSIVGEFAGIPRAMAATMDLSAPMRQGLVAGVRYPRQFIKAFGEMFRVAGSEDAYTALKQNIMGRETFGRMDQGGLALTAINEGNFLRREEQFLSHLPERIPLLGRLIRASDRAYAGFLTKLRADVFDELALRSAAAGIPQTAAHDTDLSRLINTLTGRGDLGRLGAAGNALSTALFSPRLLASRINMLNPGYYMSLSPFARKEALKAMLSLVSAGSTVAGLAALAGAKVGVDPRSADFGKIKIGNTRFDIWGGFQQYPRIAAQMITGKLISSTTGRELTLGEGYKPLTRKDIAYRFFESKANPLVSTIIETMEGRTFEGEKPTVGSTAKRLLTPLILQDLGDIVRDDPTLLPGLVFGAFGVGVQTYGPPKAKTGNSWLVKKP